MSNDASDILVIVFVSGPHGSPFVASSVKLLETFPELESSKIMIYVKENKSLKLNLHFGLRDISPGKPS